MRIVVRDGVRGVRHRAVAAEAGAPVGLATTGLLQGYRRPADRQLCPVRGAQRCVHGQALGAHRSGAASVVVSGRRQSTIPGAAGRRSGEDDERVCATPTA